MYDQWQLISLTVSAMVRCKNASGGPGDDERHPLGLTAQEKAKGPKKMLVKKKHKRDNIEAERATTVAAVVERAERGGRGSGIRIGEAQFHLKGRELGTKETERLATKEPTPQVE